MERRPRIYLLSPASCSGRRAAALLGGRSTWAGRAAFEDGGVPIGDLFSFLSGLYFRGKLTYARHFAGADARIYVITSDRGLVPPGRRVGPDEMRAFADTPITEREPGFRDPLVRSVRAVREELGPDLEVILLGSLASPKYVAPLTAELGRRLLAPEAFVGLGELSRGSVLLKCVDADDELSYRPVADLALRPERARRATAGAGCVLLAMAAAALGCGGPSGESGSGEGAVPSTVQTAPSSSVAPLSDGELAALVDRLSEPGGYFDTDNLISNERSYLHVMGALEERGVSGGAYIGVGPDQNFSYMAQIRPDIAYVVDIRRDNLLQHLWFKTLFELSPTRVEYLSLMFGRPPPDAPERWTDAGLADLAGYIDGVPFDPTVAAGIWERVQDALDGVGVPLSVDERAAIGSIHYRFAQAGLDLRFTSHYRGPRAYYPTYRDLMLETDLAGRSLNYLADADRYAFLRRMQVENRVVPVVGNLAGDRALAGIGEDAAERGLVVSAFYTSNVEFYLWQDGSFRRYAATVAGLPMDGRSVIIRSYFNRFDASLPGSVPGFASTQLLHPLADMARTVEGDGFAGYRDLVVRGAAAAR